MANQSIPTPTATAIAPSPVPPNTSLQITSFARDLLRAFDAAETFAKEKGGVTTRTFQDSSNGATSVTSWTGSRVSSAHLNTEKSRKQLLNLYTRCIRDAVDDLCDLLCDPTLQNASRAQRIHAVLFAEQAEARFVPSAVTELELIKFMEDAESSFREQHDSLGRSLSNHNWVSDWNPGWRTQNLVWTLLKRLGPVHPPRGALIRPFQLMKEAAFACLFKGDYLTVTRRRCSFKQSLLQYLPVPGKWDADLTWIGSAFFISMPLASLVHSWDDGHRLAAFWGSFWSLFAGVSLGLLFLFSSYRSSYSNALLDKAARGTPYERVKTKRGLRARGMLPTAISNSVTSISTARSTAVATDPDLGQSSDRASFSNASAEEAEAEIILEEGSVLNLYQASMFVERIYGSTYIDESWMIGMTEEQLYDAVLLVLQTAGALGVSCAYLAITFVTRRVNAVTVRSKSLSQTAAFSFTSLAIASRGVPDPELVIAQPVSAVVQGSLVSFAIFSYLGALAFSCGMTSAMLSDLILRQMAFTQVKSEGTAHAFVQKFAFFIRVIGGLNSCAGLSLFTGVMVFLLSIFRVHPVAVIPLGASWLVLGSVLIDSFFTKFHFWNMKEILQDVGNVLDDPEITSPSPMAGTFQQFLRKAKKFVQKFSRKERDGSK